MLKGDPPPPPRSLLFFSLLFSFFNRHGKRHVIILISTFTFHLYHNPFSSLCSLHSLSLFLKLLSYLLWQDISFYSYYIDLYIFNTGIPHLTLKVKRLSINILCIFVYLVLVYVLFAILNLSLYHLYFLKRFSRSARGIGKSDYRRLNASDYRFFSSLSCTSNS